MGGCRERAEVLYRTVVELDVGGESSEKRTTPITPTKKTDGAGTSRAATVKRKGS
jgi:hypothetical protein